MMALRSPMYGVATSKFSRNIVRFIRQDTPMESFGRICCLKISQITHNISSTPKTPPTTPPMIGPMVRL